MKDNKDKRLIEMPITKQVKETRLCVEAKNISLIPAEKELYLSDVKVLCCGIKRVTAVPVVI